MQRIVVRAGSVLSQQITAVTSGTLSRVFPANILQVSRVTFARSLSWKASQVFPLQVSFPAATRFASSVAASESSSVAEAPNPESIKAFWEQFPSPRRGKDWSAQIQIRGYDIHELEYACGYIRHVAGLSGVRVGNVVRLPKKSQLYTVIRSPHVYKTSREQVPIQVIDWTMRIHLPPFFCSLLIRFTNGSSACTIARPRPLRTSSTSCTNDRPRA